MPDRSSFPSSSNSSIAGKVQTRLIHGTSRMFPILDSWLPLSRTQKSPKATAALDVKRYSRSSRKSPWKPLSLRWPVLTAFVAITIGFGALLAILQLRSDRNGGIFFSDSLADLQTGKNFVYLYLPTILAVLYSTAWSWIDLDSKRLEPWFELSKTEGASSEDSLFLQYPIEFLALVPFRAAKRRHWGVVAASMTMMIIFWAITPLQSGIFATKFVTTAKYLPIDTSAGLLPLSAQSSELSTNFLDTGYGVSWLNQPLPPFTSKEFALAPFRISDNQTQAASNTTLTANTTLYSTSLHCYSPAKILSDSPMSVSFDNGQGCNAEDVLQYGPTPGKNFSASYIGYFDNGNVDASLQFSGCAPSSSHVFLAIWRRSGNNTFAPNFRSISNATALFCEPSYHKQAVEATVKLPGYSVLRAVSIGPKTNISSEEFNITQFEYVLGAGVGPYTFKDVAGQTNAKIRQDIPDGTIIHQDVQLSNMSLALPTSNMVGFAVGNTHLRPDEYLDPANLSRAFEAAHQLLFAIAVAAMMEPPTTSDTNSLALEERSTNAVVLVRTFTFLVEGFLAIVIALTVSLAIHYGRRRSAISQDPNSLLRIMSMCNDLNFLKGFRSLDSAPMARLENAIHGRRFRLGRDENTDLDALQATTTIISEEDDTPALRQKNGFTVRTSNLSEMSSTRSHTEECTPQWPIALSGLTGVVLIVLVATLLALIVVLRQKILSQQGLPLPSENSIVQQLVLNYIPTSFATLMEPLLVLLNRWMCILQPFEDLRKGPSSLSKSVGSEYTSVPPQLVLWQALQSHHFMLASLSITAILANVLTVSLSGLFVIGQSTRNQTVLSHPVFEPNFQPGRIDLWLTEISYSQSDPHYVAMANITANTPLPSWTAPEYYFLPVELPAPTIERSYIIQYQANTVGFGASLECEELSANVDSNHTYEFKISRDAMQATFSTTHHLSDGTVYQCRANQSLSAGVGSSFSNNTAVPLNGQYNGTQALEVMYTMTSTGNLESQTPADVFCNGLLVGGWIRANIEWDYNASAKAEGVNTNTKSISTNETFMACRPRPTAGTFNVDVDSSGAVMHAARAASASSATGGDLMSLIELTSYSMCSTGAIWHNDNFATDWTNYLIKGLTKSDAIVNPFAPVPEFTSTAEILNDVYQRIFALQMSLKSAGFVPSSPGSSTPVTFSTVEQRVFMSETMFWISVSILAWDILILSIFYARAPPAFLPRLPTTLASVIAYFAASHAVAEFDAEAWSRRSEKRFAYGSFVGTDGKAHVGIEQAPFVVPLRSKTGTQRRRRMGWGTGDPEID